MADAAQLRQRAIKLLAVERRGATDGERSAARVALDRLLEKIGCDRAALEVGESVTVQIKTDGNHEQGMMLMLVAEIIGSWDVRFVKLQRSGGWQFWLSPVQAAELRTAWPLLQRGLAADLKSAALAFIWRNVKPPPHPNQADIDRQDTPERRRAAMLLDFATPVARHRQIERKSA